MELPKLKDVAVEPLPTSTLGNAKVVLLHVKDWDDPVKTTLSNGWLERTVAALAPKVVFPLKTKELPVEDVAPPKYAQRALALDELLPIVVTPPTTKEALEDTITYT
ncbi:MAG: hypothetical protein ACKOKF_09635, partial [Bacteroidota bacterium]